MNKNEEIERIKVLRKEVDRLRKLYHRKNISEISDEALDSLKHELDILEKKHNLIDKDSPTQKIDGSIARGFIKQQHKIKQWSFNDIFTEKELEEFDERVKKNLHTQNIEYFLEEKIDGMKIVLEYEGGKLKTALTRGDGVIGENVTDNIKTIKSVPLTLKKSIDIIVEGEVYITVKEFNRINKHRKKNEEETYANPRNLTAGTIRQLDLNILKKRKLSILVYEIAKIENEPKTQSDIHKTLLKLGFPINKNVKICKNKKEIIDFKNKLLNRREKLDYWIDGAVLKVNNRPFQKTLGFTGKAPRYSVAFKFPSEQSTSVVEKITFQIGRTGVITPVAELTPTQIAGTTVSRATLHNEDNIKKLDLRIKDTVIIQKAGDIIPQIVDVIKNLRPKNTKKFIWPIKIEECGGDGSIIRLSGKSAWVCANKNAFSMLVQKLYYFVSKSALNMDGIGIKIIEQLVEKKMIADYADIFRLTEDDFLKLESFKKKSAENAYNSIQSKRVVKLSKFLVGLSIEGVGQEVAILLSNKFKTLENIINASVEDLINVDGVGEVLAKSINNYFSDEQKKSNVEDLLKFITILEVKKKKGNLENKKIVITGTFNEYSRDEIKDILRDLGANVSEQVSKNTDYLLAGENSGSKLKKAKDLGIRIFRELKDLVSL